MIEFTDQEIDLIRLLVEYTSSKRLEELSGDSSADLAQFLEKLD